MYLPGASKFGELFNLSFTAEQITTGIEGLAVWNAMRAGKKVGTYTVENCGKDELFDIVLLEYTGIVPAKKGSFVWYSNPANDACATTVVYVMRVPSWYVQERRSFLDLVSKLDLLVPCVNGSRRDCHPIGFPLQTIKGIVLTNAEGASVEP